MAKCLDPKKKIVLGKAMMLVGIVAGIVITVFYTPVSGQAAFLLEDTTAYISERPDDADLIFPQEQVDTMNTVGQFSLGYGAFASERMYCFTVTDGLVTRFRLADYIEDSDLRSVSGGCVGNVDGFVHTQPDGFTRLSEEDKDLETDVEYTCIQYREIAESPVSGQVNGVTCWQVSGSLDDPAFEEVEVGIQ